MKTYERVCLTLKKARRFKLARIFILLLVVLSTPRCSKDSLLKETNIPKTLSTTSPDLQIRLAAIKTSFYQQKLEEKIKPTKSDRLSWYPDWENPKIQIVNDSVSYVSYEFLGKVDGKNVNITQTNGKLFLVVKNEKDFYKAFYYSDIDNQVEKEVKEFKLNSFTGNLLLSNLQNGRNYLLDYTNGHLSESYLKKGVLAVKKLQATKGAISYWEENCQYVLRNCTFSTLSVPPCAGGGVVVTFRADCSWPQAMCGYPFSLTDSDEARVCENIWFPDPPTEPIDTGGGGGSGGGDGVTDDVPDGDPSESDYLYTCPDNFSFSSVTTHDVWQEGVLTNIYCNLGIMDFMTNTISNAKTVTIPEVAFGLPYHSSNGGITYTQNEAKAISADALNMAEEDMRKKYKANPYLTSGQLADYWVARMNIRMKEITQNKGKVGRTGSINPTAPAPSRTYNPC